MRIEELVLFGIGGVFLYLILNERFKLTESFKNIISTILFIDGYFLLVYRVIEPSEDVLKNGNFVNYSSYIFFIVLALFLLVIIWRNGKELIEENNVTSLIWMLSYIVLVFSFIYFLIYYNNNCAFMYVENEKWYELAFDFLYYSFSRGLTFGGGTLEPMSFLAKLCSMVQTVIFYFVIGKGLVTYNKDKKLK